jgi:hypothetical protein
MLTCQIAGSAETDESDQTGHTARSTRADSAVRHPIAKVRQRTSIRLVARCSRLRAVLAARAAPAHETKTCRRARRVRLALASTALRTAAQRVPRQNTAVPQLRGLRVALPSTGVRAACWHTHPQCRRGGGRRRRAAGGAVAARRSRRTARPPSHCSCIAAEKIPPRIMTDHWLDIRAFGAPRRIGGA